MATQVQFRRGTTAETSAFTGAVGEVTVDTAKDTVVVHDGSTVGGFPLLREDFSNGALAAGSLGSPALKFANSSSTGLYSPTTGTFALVSSGIAALVSDTSGNLTAGGTITTTGRITGASFVPTSGTVPSNGLYLSAANTVSIATNSGIKFSVNSTGDVTITGGLTVGSTFNSSSFGLTGTPSVTPPAGLNGMYLYAANTIGFATNGTLAFRVDSSGTVTFSGGLAVSTSFSAPTFVPTTATPVATVSSIYGSTAAGIGFATAGTGRLTIDASGNVIVVSGTLTTSAGTNTAQSFIPTSATIPSNGMYLSAVNTLAFATNSGSRLTIGATGAVTIVSGGLTTSAGTNTAQSFIPTSSTIPANGMYLSGVNTLGFATNTLSRLTIDASGNAVIVSGTLTTSSGSNTATTFIPTNATAPAGVGVYADGTTGIGLATGGSGRLTITAAGNTTMTGTATAASFTPSSSSAPATVSSIYGSTATGLGFGTAGVGRLTIDASGNVIVVAGTLTTSAGTNTATSFIPSSTAAPASGIALHGVSTTGIGLSTGGLNRLTIDSAGAATFSGSCSAAALSPTTNSALATVSSIYGSTAAGLGFATAGTGRLTIDASGNVIVVAGTLTTSAGTNTATSFIPSSTAAPATVACLHGIATGGIGLSTAGSNRLSIDSSGNVTIVAGTLTTTNGSNTAQSFIPTSATVPSNGMYLSTGNTLAFATNSGSRLTISSTGAITVVSGNLTTSAGTNTAQSFIPTSATVPTNGMYLSAATTLSFATNSTERFKIDSAGALTNNGLPVIPCLYYRLNTAVAGSNVTTVQSVFGVGVTLTASTVYAFEAFYIFTKTLGGTVHNVQTLFGGTATLNNILYGGSGTFIGGSTMPTSGNSGSQNIVSPMSDSATATGVNITPNVSNASATVIAQLRGTVSVNAGGTFIPQYQLTAAPGGGYTTAIGSYFHLYPIGASGSNNSAGTWA